MIDRFIKNGEGWYKLQMVDCFKVERDGEAAGFNPEAYTLYSYAAVQIIAQAITAAGSADDAAKVAEQMYGKGPFKTVLGDISFDAKGDITRPDYVLYTWKKGADGKITYVQD